MRYLVMLLIVMNVVLMTRLFYGPTSFNRLNALESQISNKELAVKSLVDKNAQLSAEVLDLKKKLDAIEERARRDMGMIQEGETFFQSQLDEDHHAPQALPFSMG